MSQTSPTPQIDRALYFAEGTFLLVQGHGLYFLPHGHDKAYACRGEQKDLFGKTSHTMKSTDPAVQSYTLTYEIEDNQLIAARLITKAGRSKGTLLPTVAREALMQQMAQGRLQLQNIQQPAYIGCAARLPDGRTLLHIHNFPAKEHSSLWLGAPGTYDRLEIATGVQGGNSFYYKLKDGTNVDLPMDFGGGMPRGEQAKFGNDILAYLPTRHGRADFDAYGFAIQDPPPHLDPFSPELRARSTPRPPAPKGP